MLMSVACVTLVCTATDDITITTLSHILWSKEINDLLETSNKLIRNDFAVLIAGGFRQDVACGPPDGPRSHK
jgi:hypothetical protein